MINVVKPPLRPHTNVYEDDICIFLAGSIDGGVAEEWQARVEKDLESYPITLFNPRRDFWDDTWEQTISNPNFKEQVEWEMDHLDRADIIVMYFDPNGKAPITLLELGLHAAKSNIIVCCPDGYWRKGNVEVIADRFGLVLVNSYEAMMTALKQEIVYPSVDRRKRGPQ